MAPFRQRLQKMEQDRALLCLGAGNVGAVAAGALGIANRGGLIGANSGDLRGGSGALHGAGAGRRRRPLVDSLAVNPGAIVL